MAVCCQRKYGNGCFRKTTPLHHYLYSDRMAGKLCDVRHSAYSLSRKLVIDEYADSAFCRGNTGIGIIPVFTISGYLSDHKYCFHGRLFGSYFVRCHFSGAQYVSFGTRCFLSFPCPAFHGNDAKYALRGEWFYSPLAIGCDTMYLSVAGFSVTSSSETCHRKS